MVPVTALPSLYICIYIIFIHVYRLRESTQIVGIIRPNGKTFMLGLLGNWEALEKRIS